ncbi:MAG: ATP-binding protein [bacterium]
MHVCAAGQYPPFYMNGQTWKRLDIEKQMPLGILPTFAYTSQDYPLRRGDCWLLFSDGITEARNPQGEEFTEEGFLRALKTDKPPFAIFTEAVASWKSFIGDAPLHDDASLFFLDWRGLKPDAEFKQTCEPSNLCEGRKFVEAWAKFAGFSDVTVGHIVLGCDEAAANVFRHAYNGKPGPITWQASVEDNTLVLCLKDEGAAVEPSQICGRSLDELKPGGLGTVLMSQIFDHVEYLPQAKGTLLLLKKQIP